MVRRRPHTHHVREPSGRKYPSRVPIRHGACGPSPMSLRGGGCLGVRTRLEPLPRVQARSREGVRIWNTESTGARDVTRLWEACDRRALRESDGRLFCDLHQLVATAFASRPDHTANRAVGTHGEAARSAEGEVGAPTIGHAAAEGARTLLAPCPCFACAGALISGRDASPHSTPSTTPFRSFHVLFSVTPCSSLVSHPVSCPSSSKMPVHDGDRGGVYI